jgi:hypothetical protein
MSHPGSAPPEPVVTAATLGAFKRHAKKKEEDKVGIRFLSMQCAQQQYRYSSSSQQQQLTS